MKKGRENPSVVQQRTAMRDKHASRTAQENKRLHPSQNTINPNRGLNEDEQKRRTNQDEEDETTNAYTEQSGQADNQRGSDKQGKDSDETSKR